MPAAFAIPAKLTTPAPGIGVRAVRLVGAVLEDEVDQVLRGRLGDGDQRPQVHEQAAVSVEHPDAALGHPDREPPVRGMSPWPMAPNA